MDQQDYKGVTGDITTVEGGQKLMLLIWFLHEDRNGVSVIHGPGGAMVQAIVTPQIALAILDLLENRREDLKALADLC